DASNVVDAPAVSVITPVDYDHKQFLGNDLSRIAWEKAGIIKRGCPVVSAIQSDVPAGVIAEEAFALGAPLNVLSPADIAAAPRELSLLGAHQRANAALAIKALQIWGDLRMTQEAFVTGGAAADWPARLQRLASGPLSERVSPAELWLDGGHNPHAARAIAEYLQALPGRTVLVTAMMAGKDSAGFFRAFSALVPEVFTCPNASGHKGAAPEVLAAAAQSAGLTSEAHGSFDEALSAAAKAGPARILICGSLYLAGDVLSANGQVPV
ncbi:MAG: bifunctional folylpolyglutamate synthase/dihydrofolate synthase, partial [Pseudomonadota bacterium]